MKSTHVAKRGGEVGNKPDLKADTKYAKQAKSEGHK